MDVVFLIRRVPFGVLFVYSGIGHFAAGEAMQGYGHVLPRGPHVRFRGEDGQA